MSNRTRSGLSSTVTRTASSVIRFQNLYFSARRVVTILIWEESSSTISIFFQHISFVTPMLILYLTVSPVKNEREEYPCAAVREAHGCRSLINQFYHTPAAGQNIFQAVPLFLGRITHYVFEHQFRVSNDDIKRGTKIVNNFIQVSVTGAVFFSACFRGGWRQ